MSCTVMAVPYALAWVVGAVVSASAEAVYNKKHGENKELKEISVNCDDIQIIDDTHFLEKDFETPFVDKSILLKTLEEHGVVNIKDEDGIITGNVEGYCLKFTKHSENEPYSLKISGSDTNNSQEKVNNLESEYAINVQENAYMQIMEKLKENNMQLEDEVVEEDNTIVLTINID